MPQNLEPIGDLTFEGVEFDLASLPSNDEDAEQRARLLPWIRVAAVLMRHNDKELAQQVVDDPELHVEMLEGIADVIKWSKAELNILEAGFARLAVALERYTKVTS